MEIVERKCRQCGKKFHTNKIHPSQICSDECRRIRAKASRGKYLGKKEEVKLVDITKEEMTICEAKRLCIEKNCTYGELMTERYSLTGEYK